MNFKMRKTPICIILNKIIQWYKIINYFVPIRINIIDKKVTSVAY